MSQARSLPIVGKRSGVNLELSQSPAEGSLKDGELNDIFAAAAAASKKNKALNNARKNESSEAVGQRQAQPSRKMNFTLDGQSSLSSIDKATRKEAAVASTMFQKMKTFTGRSVTELDLSPVTPASPLPVKPMENKEKVPLNLKEDQYEEEKKDEHGEEGSVPELEAPSELKGKSDQSAKKSPTDSVSSIKVQSVQYEENEYEEHDDPTLPAEDEKDADSAGDGSRDDGLNDDLIPPAPPDSPEDVGRYSSSQQTTREADDNSQHTEYSERDGDPLSPLEKVTARKSSKKSERQKKSKQRAEAEEPQKAKRKRDISETRKNNRQSLSEPRKSKRGPDDDSEERNISVQTRPKKKNKASRSTTIFSPKGIPLPREFQTVPVSDFQDTPSPGVRRSNRARCPPLAFWKGEKPQYGPADGDDESLNNGLYNMTVVKGYVLAKETPYKPRKLPPVKHSHGNKNSKRSDGADEGNKPLPEFDSTKLLSQYKFNDGEEAVLWDEGNEETRDLKVVSFQDNMEARKLPISKSRPKSDGKVVGKAAQAFNVSNSRKPQYVGYITGNLILPPKGIKDAESVGSCAQVFTVVSCQPKALEVAYANPDDDLDDATFNPDSAERFLLSPGDMFRVPPGNAYRLCNHSKKVDALMSWTIIRPANLKAIRQDEASVNSAEEG